MIDPNDVTTVYGHVLRKFNLGSRYSDKIKTCTDRYNRVLIVPLNWRRIINKYTYHTTITGILCTLKLMLKNRKIYKTKVHILSKPLVSNYL